MLEAIKTLLNGIQVRLNEIKTDISAINAKTDIANDKIKNTNAAVVKLSKQPDWNESNTDSHGYINNKPFYDYNANLVYKFENVHTSGQSSLTLGTGEPFIIGETYTVCVNDESFDTEAVNMGGYPYLFHPDNTTQSLFDRCIYWDSGKLRAFTWWESGSTVSISGPFRFFKQLDSKYINFVQSDWEQTDINAADYIKNKPTYYNYIILVDQSTGYKYVVSLVDGILVPQIFCSKIKITTQPNKTTYMAGEYFDPTGMVITATYEDGSTKELTDYTYPTHYLTVSDASLEIQCSATGLSTSLIPDITINPFDEALLVDFKYIKNDDGTYELTEWKGTLNGENSTECIIPDNAFIIV